LGAPLTDEIGTPDGVGRFNHFQGGSIYWTPQHGAFEVHGAIREKWSKLGWETGYLGYPITDETKTPDGVGRFNHFQGGSIYWTPELGANAVRKEIRDEWERKGWEKGDLGYPTSDTTGALDGTLENKFQKGSISWSKVSGYKVSANSLRRSPPKTERNVPGTPVNKPFVNLQAKNLPNVNLPTNNPTCIGRGYNALNGNYVCENDVKWRYPILLLNESDIIAKNAPGSDVFTETETTLQELFKKTNTRLEVKGSYMLFSASFKAEFSKEEQSMQEYSYTKVMGIHRKERLCFKYAFSNCNSYLNPEFVADLNGNMQPADLFVKYGTHLILGIYMGGRIEANFSTEKTAKETTKEIKTRIEAGMSGPISVSGNLSTEDKATVREAWTRSIAKIRTWGGNSYTGSNYNDFCNTNPQWVKSLNDVRDKWTLCDLPKDSINTTKGYNEDFVPIWELCTNQERKKALLKHFESMCINVNNELLANEMYVAAFKIVSDTTKEKALEQCPNDFISIDVDLNLGAGGDYIYLCYKLAHKNQFPPFTNFCIEISNGPLNTGFHNCTHEGINAKYYRLGNDLNRNTKVKGDPYIYLSGTTDTRFAPIRRLGVIADDSRSAYPEWNAVYEKGTTTAADCNKGAGGAYIYVLYRR